MAVSDLHRQNLDPVNQELFLWIEVVVPLYLPLVELKSDIRFYWKLLIWPGRQSWWESHIWLVSIAGPSLEGKHNTFILTSTMKATLLMGFRPGAVRQRRYSVHQPWE